MRGIAGFLGQRLDMRVQEVVTAAARVADDIACREPDDVGNWVDEAIGIALVHRRLSVVDLSKEKEQRGARPWLQQPPRLAAIAALQQHNPKPYQRIERPLPLPIALAFSRRCKHFLNQKLGQVLPYDRQILRREHLLGPQLQLASTQRGVHVVLKARCCVSLIMLYKKLT